MGSGEPALIRLTNLVIPPSVNNLFPSRKDGRRFPSAEYQAWRKEAHIGIRSQLNRRDVQEIHGPVTLAYKFEDGSTRADLGNLEKGPTDLLVSLGIIDGDGPKVVRSITLMWGHEPGLTIEVRQA